MLAGAKQCYAVDVKKYCLIEEKQRCTQYQGNTEPGLDWYSRTQVHYIKP